MKKIFIIILICTTSIRVFSQQVAYGRNGVQLVSQPGTQLIVKGGITFTGTSNFNHKGSITLFSNPVSGNSDWRDSTTGVFLPASTGQVIFRGAAALQQIYGPTTFDSITIQNIGVNLQQSNEVRRWLGLNDGLVYFTNVNDSIYVSNPAISSVSFDPDSFATTSWVHGKLSRRLNVADPAVYEFPVGKIKSGDSLYAPVRFMKQNNVAATWSVQYFPVPPFDRFNINALLDHITDQEYWEITSHNFPSLPDNYTKLSLSWRDYSIVGPTQAVRDSLQVVHYFDDGGGFRWNVEPIAGIPALNNTAVGSVNWGWLTTNTAIGDFTMPHLWYSLGTRTVANALPVTWIDWNVIKVGATARCTWEIYNDTRVDFYDIERSLDGISFSKIGMIASVKTPFNRNYTYTDQSPGAGWNYYRIRAYNSTDIKYTTVKAVFFEKDTDWLLYPNPASDHINVVLPANVQSARLVIHDANGRLISERTVSNNRILINISSLASGVYYLEYINGNNRSVRSFVKQ